MPKKRHSSLYSKPPSTVHHSLSSARSSSSSPSRNNESPNVTELLNALRASRISSNGQRAAPVIMPSMPSEIRRLLDLPDTPSPRARVRRRIDARGRRLPAGPPPPNSWLERSQWTPVETPVRPILAGRNRCDVDSLPGLSDFPKPSSLMATCLRHMARNWAFQRHYNHYYLAALPTTIRTLLFSYLATYGPEEGVGYEGLISIMLPQDGNLDNFCGNDDFERLDLSGSIGRSVYFKQLQGLINPRNTVERNEESWDIVTHPVPKSLKTPFHSLKLLSLSNPPSSISWAKFLTFATSIPTVTHLSLANWPTPCLTPNSITTTTSSRYSHNLPFGGTSFYSQTLDNDWSEAAALLRRLSIALYCLEWLDLDGCDDWSPALRWSSADSPGINWKSCWGTVRTVRMHSFITPCEEGSTKKQILRYKYAILNALELEKHIRRQRGWIVVEHDEWEKYDGLWIDSVGTPSASDLERAYREAKVGRTEEVIGSAGGAFLAQGIDVPGRGFWD